MFLQNIQNFGQCSLCVLLLNIDLSILDFAQVQVYGTAKEGQKLTSQGRKKKKVYTCAQTFYQKDIKKVDKIGIPIKILKNCMEVIEKKIGIPYLVFM